MKKGFVISWYYPPGNSSEGLVTFKLLKNSKYQYDVWTRADQQQSMWDRKSDESKLTAENVGVIKGECDDAKKWVEEGVKYFLEHRDEYAFIMSRSMPAECHELAIKIKEKIPDVKWIASFGDPLVDTPYINDITMGGQDNPFKMVHYLAKEDLSFLRASRVFVSPTRLARKYVWRKDKQIGSEIERYFEYVNLTTLVEADVVIYNNIYQFEHAFSRTGLKKYQSKGVVLEHSYDPGLYPKKKTKKNSKITFVYVGHLDHNRNVHTLLEALSEMKKRDPELSKKVEFVFYGHMDDSDKVFILDYDLVDLVKINKDITYLESLNVIKDADWAILVDANFTSIVDDCIYLPAKLMDYMGARTNVFSISHVKGAGSDIIREVGGGKVVTHSADDIYLYLSKIIYQKYRPKPYDENEAKKYSSVEVSKRLDGVIGKVLKDKK